MGLEAASFISQLDAANPLGTDSKGQGDDHLRLIKAVLLATLPNFNAALTATPAEITAALAAVAALPNFTVGEGTPTCTNNGNFTQSGTLHHKYIRVGANVIVFASVSGNCGASAAELGTSYQLTLPIASNLGVATDLIGIGLASDGGGSGVVRPVILIPVAASDRVQTLFRAPQASDIANTQIVYIYKVI